MALYQFRKEQVIRNTSVEEVWNFISSPANLKEITPTYMGFDILSEDLPKKMYPGMIIKYRVSPLLGIKMTWVTEITHVRELEYFVDEQRVGPYSIWHHQHILTPSADGIVMKDIVSYKPPLWILGDIANKLVIENKLNEIFDYRTRIVEEKFKN